jgi:hypothetical protein
VDGHGNVWTVNPAGVVYVREAAPTRPNQPWVKRTPTGAKVTRIAAGTTNVMCIDDKKKVWHYGGATWKVDAATSNTKDIAVGGTGTLFCVNERGEYFRRTGSATAWGTKLGDLSGLTRLAAGFDNALSYLGPGGAVYDLKDGTFQADPVGKGVDLGLRNKDDVWLVNAAGEIWRRTPTAFTSPLVQATAPVTVGGAQVAVWSKIAGPDFSKARLYWVQQGDTLAQLASDLGIDYNRLRSANPQITNPDRIKAGDRLLLP